jgi:hypothetical protein
VLFEDGEGCVRSLPTAWTTVAVADPFVVLSAGRSFFRVEDLLSLVPLVKGLSTSQPICKADSAVDVNRITSL